MPNRAPLPGLETEALKEKTPLQALEFLRAQLADDPRAGAKRLLEKFEKKVQREEKEQKRLESLWRYEREALAQGFSRVAGVDEAGRGPLAGPVVAAAVILASHGAVAGIDDSKKLTAVQREELFQKIRESAVAAGVGQASVQEIDTHNIYRASQMAMERAVAALGEKPDYLLTDAMPLPSLKTTPQLPLTHGDALSLSIAAASIIAKVTRDRMMRELHQRYPQYGFEDHKGYGTEVHLRALETHGPCPEHRVSFGPVFEVLARKSPGGPVGYWKERLSRAANPGELRHVGLQIKRTSPGQLSEGDLAGLREHFRRVRDQWPSPEA